jgi:putative drug exporter of the RND superfamily
MAVIGGVIAASAITVVVGFLSQTSAQFGMYRTMGPAMGVAIFVTLIAGLTLTPAVLRLAGGHAFWPHRIERIREVGDGHSTRWADLAGAVRRLPIHALLGGVIVLLLMSAGLGWYEQSFDLVKDLPSDADSRQGFETLAEHYPGGRLSPIFIVIAGDERITDDDRLAAIDRLTDELRTQPGIGEVRSVTQPAGAPLTPETIATLGLGTGDGDAATFGLDPASVDLAPLLSAIQSERGLRFTGSLLQQYPQIAERLRFFIGADGHSTRLVVSLDDNPYDGEAMGVLRNLDDVTARTLGGSALAGAELAVGGPSSFYVDVQDIGNDDFLTITAVLLGGIFVVLALLLRSLVAPFYLLATVLFSFVATMGLTAGLFVGILDNPGLSFYMPPFLFVILVALGADYNIFIMSRIREEAEAGYEIHQATVRGLVLTGPVITSAGLILAGTFFALVLAPLPNLRQIGFAVTVGVLIDTFIVRSFLVPSITMLLGNWAFWPTTPGVERSTVLGVRRVGLAAAGVIAFALSLILLVSAGDTEPAITRIASMDAGSGIQLDPPLARPPGATSSAVGAVAVPSSSDQDAGVPPGPGAVTQASHMPHRPLTSPRWS